MVLAALVIIFLILAIGIPNITGAFANLSKTPEQRKKEEEKAEEKAEQEATKQKTREDEGLGGTALRILIGDAAVDAQKEKNQLRALQEQKEALEKAGLIPKDNAPTLTTATLNKIVEEEIQRAGGRTDPFLIPLSSEKMTQINQAVASATKAQLEEIIDTRQQIEQLSIQKKTRTGRRTR